MTGEDIAHFAEFTGDTFYAHTDPSCCEEPALRWDRRARLSGVSLAAGLFVEPNPGPVLANFGVDNLRFLTPAKVDDAIAVTLTVKAITPCSSADYGEVRWDAVVTNQHDEPVATYDVLTLVAKEEARCTDHGRLRTAHQSTNSRSTTRTPHVDLVKSCCPAWCRFTTSHPRSLGDGKAPYFVVELCSTTRRP